MKLIDLLSVIDENLTVVVCADDVEIARYDGRNSIPKRYNNKTVLFVTCHSGRFYIEIDS